LQETRGLVRRKKSGIRVRRLITKKKHRVLGGEKRLNLPRARGNRFTAGRDELSDPGPKPLVYQTAGRKKADLFLGPSQWTVVWWRREIPGFGC